MTENRTAQKATMWVVLVFFLGVGLGSMAGFVYAHHKFPVTNAAAAPTALPVSDAQRRALKVQELSNTANLTIEQTHQVEGIVADLQSRIKAIRKTTDPQVDEVRK